MSPRSFSKFLPSAAVLALTTLCASSLYALPSNLGLGLGDLAQDYRDARTNGAKTLSHEQFLGVLANHPLARTDAADRVLVDVYLDGSQSVDDSIAAYGALGCTTVARVDWYRHGALTLWMPLDKAGKLGKLQGVSSVLLSTKPRHRAGKIATQGAVVLKSNLVNANGYLGTGITVGALSDSYNQLNSTYPVHAPDDVTSGDLPGTTNPEGYLTPVNVLLDNETSGEDEGRAMLQVIHDVAPAAKLAFATADVSEIGFAANITALAGSPSQTFTIPATANANTGATVTTTTVNGAGCNVICDDVGYFDEPMFSDGIVAQAVDNATAGGVTYFSSAGNDGNSGYAATFSGQANTTANQALLLTQGGITYTGITSSERTVISKFHSFGTDATGNPILVQKVRLPGLTGTSGDATGVLIFQWDDPSLVVTNGVKQVSTDYDILVFSVAANGTATYQRSLSGATNNITGNTPVELAGYFAIGTQYELVIVQTTRSTAVGAGVTANAATHIRWAMATDDTHVIADFVNTKSPESYGHPCSATCLGTAAYVFDASPNNADPNHVYSPVVEEFSSNGPSKIYFDAAGNRLATPITRKQPTIATIDGGDTTFFPPYAATVAPGPTNPSPYDYDGDGYPNFFGTSEAAPHGAGCAALLLNAAAVNGVTLTPLDVRSLFISTTQGKADQDAQSITTTAGPVAFTGLDRGTFRDSTAFTVAFGGTAGQTLSSLVFNLTPANQQFYASSTSSTANPYPFTVGATSGTTTPTATAVISGTANSPGNGNVLTATFGNFVPGDTLSFGIGHLNSTFYTSLIDAMAGGTITATVTNADASTTVYTGTLTNTYDIKWNVKSGYGLLDVNAAVNKLLGH